MASRASISVGMSVADSNGLMGRSRSNSWYLCTKVGLGLGLGRFPGSFEPHFPATIVFVLLLRETHVRHEASGGHEAVVGVEELEGEVDLFARLLVVNVRDGLLHACPEVHLKRGLGEFDVRFGETILLFVH